MPDPPLGGDPLDGPIPLDELEARAAASELYKGQPIAIIRPGMPEGVVDDDEDPTWVDEELVADERPNLPKAGNLPRDKRAARRRERIISTIGKQITESSHIWTWAGVLGGRLRTDQQRVTTFVLGHLRKLGLVQEVPRLTAPTPRGGPNSGRPVYYSEANESDFFRDLVVAVHDTVRNGEPVNFSTLKGHWPINRRTITKYVGHFEYDLEALASEARRCTQGGVCRAVLRDKDKFKVT